MRPARICDHCGHKYFMNFANGSGYTHCNNESCVMIHQREVAEQNRKNTYLRRQLVRRMSAGVAV